MSAWPKIEKIAESVSSGQTTALANVEKSLKLIKEHHEYQAIISITESRAIERAKKIDKDIKDGKKVGRLAGVPFILKDNFLAFGSETTAASNMLKIFNPPYQASVVEKLEAEGAICVAKANLDAFAHGSSTEHSDIFTTKHPQDKQRVPGGSSGGSATAVMLDLAPFSLGTDTGGSIRLPASFTGAVGLKPSYGLVSRYGVIAMASSTDVIGPITKNVEDSAYVLDIIAGRDVFDSTTIEREDSYLVKNTKDFLKGKRIGVIAEYMGSGLSSDIRLQVEQTIEKLKQAGAVVETVSLPSLPLALSVYYIICPAEVSSNLSRYDGLRFGHNVKGLSDLTSSYEQARAEGFGSEAKRRIMIGTYVLSSGYYDAYYKKAALVRTKMINEFNDVLQNFDYLIGPTAPMTAFKIGDKIEDPMQMYLTDIMTVAANLVGIPAISIPVGNSEDLPVGLQIMGKFNQDKSLLDCAHAVEAIL